MVSSAECAETEAEDIGRHFASAFPKAGQILCRDCIGEAVRRFPDVHSGRDLRLGDAVKFREVDPLFFEFCSQHPAADIHADKVRDHFIPDRHGRTDHTAGAGVAVRHNAHLQAFHRRLIHQVSDLRDRGIVAVFRKDSGSVVDTFYFYHSIHSPL